MTTYVPFARLDASQLTEARAIYESSFPPHQRDEFDPEYWADDPHCFVALDAGTTTGICLASILPSSRWVFLGYFAVAPVRRGSGIGAAMMSRLTGVATREGAHGIVLEIEDPDEPDVDDSERVVRRRRQRFYEHCGAFVLPVDEYVVPFVDGTGSEPFRLLGVSCSDGAPPAATVGRIVAELYEYGYDVGPEDPRRVRALRSIRRPA